MPEARGPSWGAGAALLAVAIVALRLVALAFDGTDLFVDEVQYWLWGQNPDFGYYSKPPLIAWILRAVTDLAGSDARFVIRAVAPVMHGLTALPLYFLARRIATPRAGFWTVAAYLTLPIVAVGSYMISTDTILAPFYAAALLVLVAMVERPTPGRALLVGALVGLAFMAKYAGIYFLMCLGLGALVIPALRIGWRNALLMLGAFLAVIAPNLAWNIANDLTTVSHTLDNADWVNDQSPLAGLSLADMGTFVASQAGVFGPVFFVVLFLALGTADRAQRILLAFSLPILVLVSGQALMSGAYANWAFPAWLAATPLVVTWLLARGHVRWLALGIGLNTAICLLLPVLYVAPGMIAPDGRPAAARYLGRSAFSTAALDFARDSGAEAIVADHRDILADLMWTGRAAGIAIHAAPHAGPPRHYYDQRVALPEPPPGRIVYAGAELPAPCTAEATRAPDLSGTAYDKMGFRLFVTTGACLASDMTSQ